MAEFPETPKPKLDFFAALARMLDDLVDAAARTRAAVGSWMVEHEEGISLFFVTVLVLGDVLPSVGELVDDWRDGPWRHVLANLELTDALALLVQLARDNHAVEGLLEAVLTNPDVIGELSAELEQTPLTEPLRSQLRHGLDLLAEHDYVLAVPALIQSLEGAFWHVAEERQLIRRDGDKMRRMTADGFVGKPVGGVETVLELLDLDPAYRTFLCKLVFGGRGNRFRHGNALEGWRLEALLLLVALTTWLEHFGPSRPDSYLRRAFAGSEEPLAAVAAAFPALSALAAMKPDAIKPTLDALMMVADMPQLRPARLRTEGTSIP
jgi:hypothetical protein